MTFRSFSSINTTRYVEIFIHDHPLWIFTENSWFNWLTDLIYAVVEHSDSLISEELGGIGKYHCSVMIYPNVPCMYNLNENDTILTFIASSMKRQVNWVLQNLLEMSKLILFLFLFNRIKYRKSFGINYAKYRLHSNTSHLFMILLHFSFTIKIT